jgi:hypothetical protein
MGPPSPDPAAYAYLGQASLAAFAWEFLRRSTAYQRDWRCFRTLGPPQLRLSGGAIVWRPRRRYPLAESWGLGHFVDPALDARLACPFWLPTLYRRSVTAIGLRAGQSAGEPFDFASWHGLRGLRVGLDGAVELACEMGHYDFGLRIQGLNRPAGRFDLVFQLKAFDHCRDKAAVIGMLERLVEGPTPLPRSPSPQGVKLAAIVVALDGRTSGLSYRQIATLLFGEARVAEDWNGPSRSLKDRTRRMVRRGVDLVAGGYRELLG